MNWTRFAWLGGEGAFAVEKVILQLSTTAGWPRGDFGATARWI